MQNTVGVVDKNKTANAGGKKRSKKKSPATAPESAEQSVEVAETAAKPSKQSAKHAGNQSVVLDLLTPVDLIKKSSSNRARQKAAPAQAPAEAEAAADQAEDAANPAPAAKKVATRGRNANLQVVEIEPKPKQGKRKAAAGNAQQPAQDMLSADVPASDQPETEAALPNMKRAKQSKSTAKQSAAEAVLEDAEHENANACFREVPGLPGVRHKMPQIPAAAASAAIEQPVASQKPERKTAAHSGSHSNAGKSGNSRKQPVTDTAAQSSSAGNIAEAAAAPGAAAEHAATARAHAADKPADTTVPAAQQSTLATGSDAQATQFQTLQVRYQIC